MNPNWRLTFTDSKSNEKQRIPYAFAIQHRGPHAELAVRFQFGFVNCEGAFATVPEKFDVDNGWEVTFPVPFSGIRFAHTVIRADGVEGVPTNATVYCVDLAFGFTAGFQKAVSGVGMKVEGAPEATWRGDVATLAFVAALLWSFYNLVKLPSTWMELRDELNALDDDPQLQMFETLDFDGDGYVTREDVHNFAREAGLQGQDFNADAVFDALDISRSGQVSFEEFQGSMQALMQMMEGQQQQMQGMSQGMSPGMSYGMPGMPLQGLPQTRPGREIELKPFGGAFSPGMMGTGGLPRFP